MSIRRAKGEMLWSIGHKGAWKCLGVLGSGPSGTGNTGGAHPMVCMLLRQVRNIDERFLGERRV